MDSSTERRVIDGYEDGRTRKAVIVAGIGTRQGRDPTAGQKGLRGTSEPRTDQEAPVGGDQRARVEEVSQCCEGRINISMCDLLVRVHRPAGKRQQW